MKRFKVTVKDTDLAPIEVLADDLKSLNKSLKLVTQKEIDIKECDNSFFDFKFEIGDKVKLRAQPLKHFIIVSKGLMIEHELLEVYFVSDGDTKKFLSVHEITISA